MTTAFSLQMEQAIAQADLSVLRELLNLEVDRKTEAGFRAIVYTMPLLELTSSNMMKSFLDMLFDRYAYKDALGWNHVDDFAKDVDSIMALATMCQQKGDAKRAIYIALTILDFLLEVLELAAESHEGIYELIQDVAQRTIEYIATENEEEVKLLQSTYAIQVEGLYKSSCDDGPTAMALLRFCFADNIISALTELYEGLESNRDFDLDMSYFILAEIILNKRLGDTLKVRSLIDENTTIPVIRKVYLFEMSSGASATQRQAQLETAIFETDRHNNHNWTQYVLDWRLELFQLLKTEGNVAKAHDVGVEILIAHGYRQVHLHMLLSLYTQQDHAEILEGLLHSIGTDHLHGRKLYLSILVELRMLDELAKTVLHANDLEELKRFEEVLRGEHQNAYIAVYKNHLERRYGAIAAGYGYAEIIDLVERLMGFGEMEYCMAMNNKIRLEHGRKKSLVHGLALVESAFRNDHG